jgi:hypothetical protein
MFHRIRIKLYEFQNLFNMLVGFIMLSKKMLFKTILEVWNAVSATLRSVEWGWPSHAHTHQGGELPQFWPNAGGQPSPNDLWGGFDHPQTFLLLFCFLFFFFFFFFYFYNFFSYNILKRSTLKIPRAAHMTLFLSKNNDLSNILSTLKKFKI